MTPQLLDDALAAMSSLNESLEPNDNEQQDATVPAAALRNFVDVHATLLFERKRYAELPTYSELQISLQNMVSAQHAGPITDEMSIAWTAARELLKTFNEVSHG